ncbi:MAG: phosphate transport system permease protein [Acidimicrobiaceae bacterium]|jgi:phosphate transport system permease protein
MTVLDVPPPSPAPVDEFDLLTVTLARSRRWKDRVATWAMLAAFLVAAIPLAAVMVVVVQKGQGVVRGDWFTQDIPTDIASAALAEKFGAVADPVVYGMQPAIIGTLVITLLASFIAIPIGILGAIYLNEYGKKRRLASAIRFLTDVMTGVPSVVMGIFIYTVWVLHFHQRTTFAGALALACLMLPIVVRSTEEMLKLVPDNLREASAALGTRTWRTTVAVVLPAALPGITSGCMLALARAAGETAPLLFTVGSISRFPGLSHLVDQLGQQNTALSTQIFSNATQPGGEPLAWGAALTLIVMVLVLTLLARFVTARFASLRS